MFPQGRAIKQNLQEVINWVKYKATFGFITTHLFSPSSSAVSLIAKENTPLPYTARLTH